VNARRTGESGARSAGRITSSLGQAVTFRRECLDHLIILSEPHLQGILAEYALSCFNTARPHQGSANGFRSPVNVTAS
jgi:hypothetical protein